jgi:hypothetical protein
VDLFRSVCVACASLLCGVLLGGCGSDDGPSLSEVKKFDAYPVYYAGAEVAGQPLEEILGDLRQKGQQASCCTFIYGHCDPPPTGEGGCPPPVEIQVSSTCRRWASALHRRRFLYDFRGAKAAGHAQSGIEDPIEIFTGRTTVVVFSEDQSLAMTAARRLHDVRAARPQPRLPPPVRGSLWGKLPCQVKPG